MSKKKKIIITIVVFAVIAGLIAGGIYAYIYYQKKNLTAEVQPVQNLNWQYWGDEMSSSGMVTNDFYQDVFLLDQQTISEVYVEEGQQVKAGDPLMAYDMTMANLELEMQQLEVETIGNKIMLKQRELEKLRKMSPIPDPPVIPEEPELPVTPPEPELPPEPEVPLGPELTEQAYNYISLTAKSYQGGGTEKDPFVYLCTPESYIMGEFFNSFADSDDLLFFVFEIREGNKEKGKLLLSWPITSQNMMRVAEDSKWSVKTRQEIIEEEPDIDEPVIDEPVIDEPVIEEPVEGYTASELHKLRLDAERELKELDLEKRKALLKLEQTREISADGVVAAKLDGVIKTVGDKEKPPVDGSAFITVSGSEGLYVSGSLGELMLGTIDIGQVVYANSWESGKSFEATITEISPYPSESNNSSGEGNPNVSYYPYVAYIENTEGLKNGEYVELRMTPAASTDQGTGQIYLPKAYVREENGKSYVLKADKSNRLVKQYLETGKTIYGEAVEIKSGLTMEDKIAFPYGKTAKEGIKVTENTDSNIGVY